MPETMSKSTDILVLEEFLPFRLNRLSELISLDFAQHYKREYGMTRPEWRTLAVLGQHGKLTSTQICGYSTMHKTKVSRAVQSLAQRGWLKRKRDTTDRRMEYVQLSVKGQKIYIKLADLARKFEDDLKCSLSTSAYSSVQKALLLLENMTTAADVKKN